MATAITAAIGKGTCDSIIAANELPNRLDRGVKQKGYQVLAGTNCLAVLVETAFIDNPDDAKLLVDREDDFTANYSLPDTFD